MAQASIPSMYELNLAFFSDLHAIEYLIINGVLERPSVCLKCDKKQMELKEGFNIYRCKACRAAVSMYRNTFLANSKLKPSQVLLFGYHWLLRTPNTAISTIMGGISSETVCNWNNHFNQAVAMDYQYNEEPIGGENIVVEIDESKFGKRMYHKGHKVEGVWVVGGVERTDARRMFAICVKDRSEATLSQIIRTYVHPGSIVHTDCWAGYSSQVLSDMGVAHATVNHSKTFKDADTGVHTNTIEGNWAGIKMKVHKRHRTATFMPHELCRILWEREHKDALWQRLIYAIAQVEYS